MTVIGFLNYTDFLTELKQTPLWGQPVRVQHYHKSKPDRQGMLRLYTFIVEAAIALPMSSPMGGIKGGDVFVCRFITGKTNIIPGHDRDQLTELDRRNRAAAEILRQALRSEDFPVRAGLIAAADDSQTEADPDGLWTADELSSLLSGGTEGGENDET